MTAVTDSGLPVEYYVDHGPAVVVEGKLVVRDLPARARFPIELEVVAWQAGRGIEPRVKSAPPVPRTLWITAE